jgi:quinoprotein dehydrogenase-associated probable ABC transporter substrate-binding protein
MRRAIRLCVLPLLVGLGAPPALLAQTPGPAAPQVLRVCADPNNLPFSNARGEGFEDKIAALLANRLHDRLEMDWGMAKLGFLRRTLQARLCDVVMGITPGYPGLATTRPYYRSAYVWVTAADRHLHFASFDDPALRKLKIGLHAIGAGGSNPPPAQSMAKRGLGGSVVGFAMYDSAEVDSPAGRIIDAVAAGQIDAAAVWGPFGGYFGRPYGDRLVITPMASDAALPGLPFAYDIAIGVRKQDTGLRDALDGALVQCRADIAAILADYHVPVVPNAPL